MNYDDYVDFPFPRELPPDDNDLKEYFMSLSDETQFSLLNGSDSYDSFRGRVADARGD